MKKANLKTYRQQVTDFGIRLPVVCPSMGFPGSIAGHKL